MEKAKRKIKTYEELEFTDDFMFGRILQENLDLCRELVELILDRKIGGIVTPDKQKAVKITYDGKGVRFDIFFSDSEGVVYDVDMQTTAEASLARRMRYYQGMIDLDVLKAGTGYDKLPRSYVIFICLSNPYPEQGLHKYTFRNVCMEERSFVFDDDTHKIILSAKGDRDDVSEEMRAFLDYLVTRRAESDLTLRLEKKVLEARENLEWRADYMTLLERDERMREEGRAEGRAAGQAEGIEIGVLGAIRNLMDSMHMTAEEAMNALKIPDEDRERFLRRLSESDPASGEEGPKSSGEPGMEG